MQVQVLSTAPDIRMQGLKPGMRIFFIIWIELMRGGLKFAAGIGSEVSIG